jgi:hypothetical protein
MAAPQNSYTDFPNGVTSFGIPVLGGGPGKFVTAPFGRTWFVNTNSTIPAAGWAPGSDGNSGTSPTSAFLTMDRAFDSVNSGDVINFTGKITEQLVTPVQIFDVWINGCGNRPRHADSTPSGGQYAAAQWAPPASGGTAAQATLRVLQQGWRFTNFLMTAIDANAACLELVRNAGAGDAERDASHASVLGMRFSGAGIGIRSGVAGTFTEIVFNVEVGYSQFDNMTTAMSGAIESNQWYIHDNFFGANTSQIIMAARNFLITRNSIGAFTAAGNSGGIDLSGGTGLNQVTGNNLSGTYSNAGGYVVANANDNWYGNASSAGFTANDPA